MSEQYQCRRSKLKMGPIRVRIVFNGSANGQNKEYEKQKVCGTVAADDVVVKAGSMRVLREKNSEGEAYYCKA